MKLNLIEWNRVVAALRIAATDSHARNLYVEAENYTALADKIETEDRS